MRGLIADCGSFYRIKQMLDFFSCFSVTARYHTETAALISSRRRLPSFEKSAFWITQSTSSCGRRRRGGHVSGERNSSLGEQSALLPLCRSRTARCWGDAMDNKESRPYSLRQHAASKLLRVIRKTCWPSASLQPAAGHTKSYPPLKTPLLIQLSTSRFKRGVLSVERHVGHQLLCSLLQVEVDLLQRL